MASRTGTGWRLAAVACCAVACGSTPDLPPNSPGVQTLLIVGFQYSPSRLEVPPGGSVMVVNQDPTPHSVTSEAAPGTYVFGAVGDVAFDTGPFVGVRTFPIPATAVPGTVVPFFCEIATSAMGEGEIVIVPP